MNEEYSHHAPLSKSKIDVNNMHEHQKRIDHNFSDALPQTNDTSTPPAPSAAVGPNGEGVNLIHANGSWLETNTMM